MASEPPRSVVSEGMLMRWKANVRPALPNHPDEPLLAHASAEAEEALHSIVYRYNLDGKQVAHLILVVTRKLWDLFNIRWSIDRPSLMPTWVQRDASGYHHLLPRIEASMTRAYEAYYMNSYATAAQHMAECQRLWDEARRSV